MYRVWVKIAENIVANSLLWGLIAPFVKLFELLNIKREQYLRSQMLNQKEARALFASLEVLNGPFKGMKYPKADAIGGLVHAKLMGSYELELNEIIAHALKQDYKRVIDIGCAEGYYAIGFARALPNAKVIAYDIDAKARKLCAAMALLNQVSNVEIKSFCSPEDLASQIQGGRNLIVSDCESYEKTLFSPAVCEALKDADVLIETHDFMDLTISDTLEERFKNTHEVLRIKSIDDIQKAKQYEFPQTERLSQGMKRAIFSEARPAIMEWLWCKPKA